MRRMTMIALVATAVLCLGVLAGCETARSYFAPQPMADGSYGPSTAEQELGAIAPVLAAFGPAGVAVSGALTVGLTWLGLNRRKVARALRVVTYAIDEYKTVDPEGAKKVVATVKTSTAGTGLSETIDAARGKKP